MAAILLAAGQSRRFGKANKLLALYKGEPIAGHAAKAVCSIAPRWKIAVCTSADEQVAALLASVGFDIVINDLPESGQSRSLALGIGRAAEMGASAALIALGDMPNILPAHLNVLVAEFEKGHAPVIASSRDGVPMPPAIFAQTLFEALRQTSGDKGARSLLNSARLIAADSAMLADIDHPEDLDPPPSHA